MSSRLSSRLIGGIGIVLVIAGLVLDRIACHQVRQSYDDALLAKARALATLTEQDEDGIGLEFAVRLDEDIRDTVDQQSASIIAAEERERLDGVIASIRTTLILTGSSSSRAFCSSGMSQVQV
ncbi:MAG: hypothetical protein R3F54_27495 [Alphaproteobacteria bacterium]